MYTGYIIMRGETIIISFIAWESIFLYVVEEEQRGVMDIWCTSELRKLILIW